MIKQDNVCRKCRREGKKLFLKGEKCLSAKCAFTRRSYAPGQHGARPKKLTDYAVQLREKQKARRTYDINETQFKNYYKKAAKTKGDTGELLLSSLERRLDNVIYRLGLSDSRKQARQLVSHGHLKVNDKKVNIGSYLVKEKDKIEINKKSIALSIFKDRQAKLKDINIPSWLQLDQQKMSGLVLHLPNKEEVETDIDSALIIEFYSK
ncbi:MAG: 30S ribosomal protein S4 [Candidatus Berkelbacteria bacterium]|nr:30S ribosomal protein S4 [Candidatus Berkelbacteria bacterium]